MKNLTRLVGCIVGCELVGLAGTPFTMAAIPNWYAYLTKPVFAPPNWLFGPAWTLLYFLMGVACYLIWQRGWKTARARKARLAFFGQLALNFLWSPLFFGLRSPVLGLVDISLLWLAIALCLKYFYPISKPASYLLVPYLVWVSFALVLNAAILVLN